MGQTMDGEPEQDERKPTGTGPADTPESAPESADEQIDEASDESFPASDPPAMTGTTAGAPRKKSRD